VYRNLLALVEAGLVQRMDLGDHVWRFELARAPEPHASHPHFVCTECGQVECLDDVEVELKAPRGSSRALGSRAVQVQLRGRCEDCD
jgi:Fur family ferric uptake transcriptional regulator